MQRPSSSGKGIFAEAMRGVSRSPKAKATSRWARRQPRDAIWLCGGAKADVEETVRTGRSTGIGAHALGLGRQARSGRRSRCSPSMFTHWAAENRPRRSRAAVYPNATPYRAGSSATSTPRPRPASLASPSRPVSSKGGAQVTTPRWPPIYPKRADGTFRDRQVGGHDRHARHLLPAAVDSLGSGPGLPGSGLPARFRQSASVLRPDRDLAAGIVLHHRRPDRLGARAFPRHVAGGRMWCGYACPQTVWTDLHDHDRALLAGRSQRPHRASMQAPGRFEKIWKKATHTRAWRRSSVWPPAAARLLFPRRADAGAPSLWTGDAPLVAYAFMGIFAGDNIPARRHRCASRSASTCVRGRASRRRCSTPSRCSSPIATMRGEPRGAHKKGQPWARPRRLH